MDDFSQFEQDLLSQLKSGNEQAFHKIYKLYSASLYSSLLSLVKSHREVQEILQDVFLKIWTNRQSIDIEKSFRSYLFKIAENKAYDFFRKTVRDKKRRDQLIDMATTECDLSEELFFTNNNMEVLENAIDSLPAQRKQVFRLCKIEGKSYKQVSELLGISVSTISDHIVKATKTIHVYINSNKEVLLSICLIIYSQFSEYLF